MTLDATHNQSIADLDKERVLHPVSSIADVLGKGPFVVSGASGARVTGEDGKDYIDCGAGLWCANIGYGRKEMAEVAKTATESLSYFHMFAGATNAPAAKLADRVLRLFHEKTPATHLSKVFFGQSGSDANDTNFKLVRYYNNLRGKPEKKKFIARWGGYHGLTYAATSLTGIPGYHKAFDAPLPEVLHVACPHYYRNHKEGESEEAYADRLVKEIEDLIAKEGGDTIAAFIAEPVMGTGGVFLPPKGYFAKIQALLKKHDILFIADEVITGFGRLGKWFASGLYDMKPDIVTLAKGITSAYFPLSASVISDEIWDVMLKASPEAGPMMHGFTYTGHPVGCALGLANLDIVEKEGLVQRAAEMGGYLLSALKEVTDGHPFVGDVRGEGFMLGVEYMADPATRKAFPAGTAPHRLVSEAAKAEGVLARALPYLEVMAFSPPFVLTRAETDEAVERYARALKNVTPELEKRAGGAA